MIIHTPPLLNNILTASHSDHLSHVVLECREIKPLDTTQYSTQYQINEQCGSFNGIDTFTVSDLRQFDITLKLF